MLNINLTPLSRPSVANSWQKALELVADKAVELQNVSSDHASGEVAGTSTYQAEVHCSAGQFSKMRCDCRAFEFHKICKHGIALAIAASGNTSVISPEILKKSEAKRQRENKRLLKEESEHTLLSDYLKTQDKSKLESTLLRLITADKTLKKSWLLKAEFSAQAGDPKVLKKRITQTLPLKHLFQYHQVAQYFYTASEQIGEVLDAAQSLDTETRFDIVMTVYKRLNKVFERVDDSGGFRFELIAKLDKQLEDSFNALNWTDKKKAQWLKKYAHPPFDVFADVTKFSSYREISDN